MFNAERTFILVTTKAKKPDPFAPELMTELQKASDIVNNLRESHRASPYFNHLSAVAEGIVALGWFFESKPAAFVTDMAAGMDAPKSDPAEVAVLAVDAIAAGAFEVLAADVSRGVQAGLAGGVAAVYPQLAR